MCLRYEGRRKEVEVPRAREQGAGWCLLDGRFGKGPSEKGSREWNRGQVLWAWAERGDGPSDLGQAREA